MDGVHDMGGMHGFGAVVRPGWDATHTEGWEIRVQVLSMLSNRSSRALIEAIEPAEYLATDYYGRWLIAAEWGARGRGVDDADLERWRAAFEADPSARPPVDADADRVDSLRAYLARPFPIAEARNPRFAVDDEVRVTRDRIEEHHRCPRYVKGAAGTIERICGDDWPAGGAPRDEDDMEAFYTVRFSSLELWGERSTEPEFSLFIDLWETHLEPA